MKLVMELEWADLKENALFGIWLVNGETRHRILTFSQDEPKTSLERRSYWEGVANELRIPFELDESAERFFDNGRKWHGKQYD